MKLEHLILDLKGNRTYRQLSDDCGGTPTTGRIQQMATKPDPSFPNISSIRGLARGLRVSPIVVVNACAESLGLADEGQRARIADLLPPEARNLTDEQVAAVLHVIQAMIPPAPARKKEPTV